MEEKILFVVTSVGRMGNTEMDTGYYLSEAAYPWKVLHDSYDIDFVSPEGGKAPVEGFDLNDSTNKEVWENEEFYNKVMNTMVPNEVHPEDYKGIFFVGGHGTMWDFPKSTEIMDIAVKIYENGGIIGAVCHGPAIFYNMRLNDGNYLIDGLKITAFTNEEETHMNLETTVPFLLESALISRGAIFEKDDIFKEKVVIDKRIITGQNPASAKKTGEKMLELLNEINED
ncbi:MAG TPA: type 1 glutamine amidotransferase domain-containing protein [Dysgonomonas sp.]|nr:type 1 glutamine amidotransferase domain-containing protein [Dysgonomonas sp.]